MADRIGRLFRSDLIGRVIDKLGEQLVNVAAPGRRRERRERAESAPVELAVIVAQYDRRKYEGSIERLLGFLESLEGVNYSLIVVDNREPGDWEHRITDRLTHIGGDNSAWEFSAFDQGLAYVERTGLHADVYAFMTDAHRAYGASFLSLIDATLLRTCAKHRAAIGWVDAWPAPTSLFGRPYQEWFRTSFLLLTVDALSIVRPFAAPIDPNSIFSNDPHAPFLPGGPLGDGLKNYLLEWLSDSSAQNRLTEGWHSRFTLDRGTFALFRDKVSAIVREHSLSIRLREAKVACFDYRLFERIGEGGLRRDDFDWRALAAFEWGKWNADDDGVVFRPLRYHLDCADIPSQTLHGEAAEFRVEGWVMAATQPEVIRLRVGSDRSLLSLCNEARDDVVRAYPSYGRTRPGFRVHGSLRDLPPGTHPAVLELDAENSVELGRLEVLPLFEFSARRLAFPTSWPSGRQVPFAVDGELRSTLPAERVTAKIDGSPIEASVFLGEGVREPSGVWLHEVTLNGFAGPLDSRDHHALELGFSLSGSTAKSWTLPFSVAAIDVPCTVQRLSIGPYDPETGLTAVALDLDVFDVEPDDRLVLERNGAEILETDIRQSSVRGANGAPRAFVVLERHVPGIQAGSAQFALIRRRGRTRSVVWTGQCQVKYRHPEIHLEELTVSIRDPARLRSTEFT